MSWNSHYSGSTQENPSLLPKQSYRRFTTLGFGVLLGLLVAVFTQIIPQQQLIGIPLYQPPAGEIGNSLGIILAMTLLTVLAGWFSSSFFSVMLAAFVTAALMMGLNLLTGDIPIYQQAASMLVSFFLLVPVTGMLVPLFAAIRIGVNQFTDHRREFVLLPKRSWLLIGVMVFMGWLCSLTFFSEEAITVMKDTQWMLLSAAQTQSADDLPAPLQEIIDGDYLSQAGKTYQLEFQKNFLGKYEIPYHYVPDYMLSATIAHYDNGWNLVCLYTGSDSNPTCRGFTTLP
ncbi:MAG TPA: hypothetical protein PKD23_05845 [Bellilinea sp.]|jgi:hypothetical protein|nr:hypothetical protein [Bellilinea sp.]